MNLFDLIRIQELRSKFNDRSALEEKIQILEQIDQICDCQYPDGHSTWEDRYFHKQCAFCSKSDA
jgi:hypothetical protein